MLSLKAVQGALQAAQIPCRFEPFPSLDVPYLVLGPDADPRVRAQQSPPEEARIGGLVFMNDILQAAGQPISKLDWLQLSLTLNIEVPPACVSDCQQLLAALNQRLLLGNLGLNSAMLPYFRYHWQLYERQLLPETVVSAVRLAYQQCAQYEPRIRALALGETRLQSALEGL